MSVESNPNNTIKDLDTTNPKITDQVSKGPDHFWMIKKVLKNIFKGKDGLGWTQPITVSEAEVNFLSGVTAGIQNQLNNKSPLVIPGYTAWHAVGVNGSGQLQTLNVSGWAVEQCANIRENIQQQIDSKLSAGFGSANASRVVVTNLNGDMIPSPGITSSELGMLDGCTQNIQNALSTLNTNKFDKAGGTVTGDVDFNAHVQIQHLDVDTFVGVDCSTTEHNFSLKYDPSNFYNWWANPSNRRTGIYCTGSGENVWFYDPDNKRHHLTATQSVIRLHGDGYHNTIASPSYGQIVYEDKGTFVAMYIYNGVWKSVSISGS